MAVYRFENMNRELDRVIDLFEKEKIDCVILKGSYIRKYYPEMWLRTSCDIDVLIHNEDAERAINLLKNRFGYEYKMKNLHDYQLYSKSRVHLELHYSLIEKDTVLKAEKQLDDVWEYVIKLEGYDHIYRMNDDMFYYYHVIHMAKHLLVGGCGIKPIIDTFIINKNFKFSPEKEKLLERGELKKLESVSRKLAYVWFGDEESDEKTERLGQFIVFGGVYGNMENRVAASKNRKGGSLGYAFFRIFLPYRYMTARYPELEKRKYMYPLYQLRRWYEIIFKGRAEYSINELKISQTMSEEKVEQTSMMLEDLGL